jgi:hypothetical protein
MKTLNLLYKLLSVATLLSGFMLGCKDKEVTPASQIEGSWKLTGLLYMDNGKEINVYNDLDRCDKTTVWVFKAGKINTTNTSSSCDDSDELVNIEYVITGSTLSIQNGLFDDYQLSFSDKTMTWTFEEEKLVFTRQ